MYEWGSWHGIAAISFPKETLKILKVMYRKTPDARTKIKRAMTVTNEIIDTLYKFSMSKLKNFLRTKEIAWLVKLFLEKGCNEDESWEPGLDILTSMVTSSEDFSEWIDTLYQLASVSLIEHMLSNSMDSKFRNRTLSKTNVSIIK